MARHCIYREDQKGIIQKPFVPIKLHTNFGNTILFLYIFSTYHICSLFNFFQILKIYYSIYNYKGGITVHNKLVNL